MYPNKQTTDLASELGHEYPELTTYETLDIATKMMQNNLIARANVLDHQMEGKSALEFIGIQLSDLCSKIDMLDDSIMELNNKEE
jgi:hypothetical protein